MGNTKEFFFKRTGKMYLNDSKENPILSAAMKALQDRIHELESANDAFRREITLSRLKLNDKTYQNIENEGNTLSNVNNTVQMVSSTAETLRELRQIKRENRLLHEEAEQLEEELGSLLRENNVLSLRNKKMNDQILDGQELQSEYESFILHILSPPPIKKNVKLDVVFVKNASTKKTHSMPAKLQMQINKLRSLPSDFSFQRIETKKDIIQALLETKEMIDELNYEIDDIEINCKTDAALKRAQKNLQAKYNYVAALTQEANRFKIF